MLPHQERHSRSITWSIETSSVLTTQPIPAYGHLRRLEQDLPEMHRHLERIVQNTLRSGSGSLQLGPETQAFEQALRAAWDKSADHPPVMGDVIALASGGSALHAILESLRLPIGSEIIVPGYTFILSANPMLHALTTDVAGLLTHAQLVPVFVDVDPATYTLDPQRVAEALTPRTKAIIAVDLHGLMAPMHDLRQIALRHDVYLLEDMSQAHGARWRDDAGRTWYAGTLADAAFASDNGLKNMGGFDADGGFAILSRALLERRPELGRFLRAWRNAGRTSSERYQHEVIGFRSRMGEYHAWKSRYDLMRLDTWNTRRESIARRFTEAIQRSARWEITSPVVPDGYRHAYFNYAVRCSSVAVKQDFLACCQRAGIEATTTYTFLPGQHAYRQAQHRVASGMHAQEAAELIVHLPCYPELTTSEIEQIEEVLAS